MLLLEVKGGHLAERPVPSMGVVPGLDEVEDGHAGLGLITEALPLDELGLEGREEALAHRVVVGVADGAHRGPDTSLFAPQPEGNGCVLRALVAVMNDLIGSTLLERHVERIEHEVSLQIRLHGPADDASAPRVDHNRQI